MVPGRVRQSPRTSEIVGWPAGCVCLTVESPRATTPSPVEFLTAGILLNCLLMVHSMVHSVDLAFTSMKLITDSSTTCEVRTRFV